jgi:uncharacterized protein (TIGR03435 family)
MFVAHARAYVRYRNITLNDARRGAFRVRDYQIVASDWMSKVRFQIEGKVPVGVSTDLIPEMCRCYCGPLEADDDLLFHFFAPRHCSREGA